MIERVPSYGLLQSGLSLLHAAGDLVSEAAGRLDSGNPDDMLEGVVGLQAAKTSMQIAGVVVRTAQELDSALLDILV